jgi:hypothetical protein
MLRPLALALALASPVVVVASPSNASPARVSNAGHDARLAHHPGVERWLKRFLQAGSGDRSQRLFAASDQNQKLR